MTKSRINEIRPKKERRKYMLKHLTSVETGIYFLCFFVYVYCCYSWQLYKMQDLSLFFFSYNDLRLVDHSLSGYGAYIARFFLQFCYYPLCGSLLFTLLNVGIQQAWHRIFGTSRFVLFAYLPSSLLLIYCSRLRYEIFYTIPPERPMEIVLLLFALSWGMVLCVGMFRKTNKNDMLFELDRSGVLKHLSLFFLFLLLTFSAVDYDRNTKTAFKMQYLLDRHDWQGMVKTAERADKPNRLVAAYRTLALVNTGELSSKLFDFTYDYPELQLISRQGETMGEGGIYAPEVNFHAGLVYASLRNLTERATVYGVSPYTLKWMVKCALLNENWSVAEKYLTLLQKTLFYAPMAQEYRKKIGDMKRVVSDKELLSVYDLVPIDDRFEQDLRKPLFIGYYTVASNGKSKRSLDLSMSACLYTKELDAFALRARALTGEKNIPKHFQEGILTYSLLKATDFDRYFSIMPGMKRRAETLLSRIAELKQTPDKGKEALAKEYGDHYLYYYYFGNRSTKSAETQSVSNGGIN